jgi:hypothetical protein
MTVVDVKIGPKLTHVSVANFKVTNITRHVSKVNEAFDYININSRVGEHNLVSLFMSLDLVDELISKLTDARESLVSERLNANGAYHS